MTPPALKRLLVIDDDDSLGDLFRLEMQQEGFSVEQATDGLKGLAKVPIFKPDVIVLDLLMPNLNGFDTLMRLQSEGYGKIPVVVMTSQSSPSNEKLIREQPNVVEFIRKPIQFDLLAALFRRLLA